MKRLTFIIIFISLYQLVFSGEVFKITARVDSVKSPGYYKIQLSHDLVSFARWDYSDIRLVNANGKEIPYIFREEKPAAPSFGFMEYPILKNEYLEKNKLSRVVIHNRNKNIISDLVVIIRNSSIEKEITLKGSDDNKNWFIIWKGYPQNIGTFSPTAEAFNIGFPKSDYEYFEISTNDSLKDPIRVIKVGYYNSTIIEGLYNEVPVMKISQKDSSDKKTYIAVILERPYTIDKLELTVVGADLFKREAHLGYLVEKDNHKVFESHAFYELSSVKPAIWETAPLKRQELMIVIENLDNPPLTIEKVRIFSFNKYLIANLKADETYFIKSGQANLSQPQYDLRFFSDSIPDSLQVLHTGQTTIAGEEKAVVSKTFFTKTILWMVISVVILVLGFFSIRMIKEMNK